MNIDPTPSNTASPGAKGKKANNSSLGSGGKRRFALGVMLILLVLLANS
jgi:hypothetical protein